MTTTTTRDFAAELAAARESSDWEAHARIWEERRLASVEADEAALDDPNPTPPVSPQDRAAIRLGLVEADDDTLASLSAGLEPSPLRDIVREVIAEREGPKDDTVLGRLFANQLPSRDYDDEVQEEPEPLDPAAPRDISILADRLGEARKLLDKLVRKAVRYGNPDISYTVGPITHTVERKYSAVQGKYIEVPGPDRVTLTIAGAAPQVGPFTFVAKVEHDPAGNVVDIIPGETVDTRFRSTPSECEHCHTIRQRKETYVLRNKETLAEVQVGSTCLKDYLGYESPAGLSQKFAFFHEVRQFEEEEWGGGGSWGDVFYITDVLSATAAVIRLYGWCSKGQASIECERGRFVESTAHLTSVFLAPPKRDKHNGDIFKRNDKIEAELRLPADVEYAQSILDWIAGGGAGNEDYGYNLKTVCARGVIEGKRLGLVCSAVQAYERAMERELRRTVEREKAKTSQWIGQEGERLRGLEVVQQSARVVSSNDWGGLVLAKFVTDEGNVLTWFTGGGTGLRDGARARLDGTVKRHSEYQGAKETQLSRCKVVAL